MKSIQRIISFLLALVMVIGMVPPMAVHAEEMESTIETVAVETVEEETVVETTAATEEATPPTEAVTEPVEETTAPTVETIPAETLVEEIISSDVMDASIVASGIFGWEDKLFWSLDDAGVLTITGNGVMGYLGYDKHPWNAYRRDIRAVFIEEGVLAIEGHSFRDCNQLSTVTLPDSLQTIGSNAFQNCTALQTIEIPQRVSAIQQQAFQGCSALRSISLPDRIKEFGTAVFEDCANMETVILPSDLEIIGQSCFKDCVKLNTIDFPETLTDIRQGAFTNCDSLSSVYLPASVTFLGHTNNDEYSFVFADCNNLTEIQVAEDNPSFCDVDGVLFNRDMTCLLQCPGAWTGSYTIPATVKTLGWRSFYGCSNLTSVQIPDSVTEIQYNAFTQCEKLSSISLPQNLKSLRNGAFSGSGLTSLIIPDSVVELGSSLLSYCTRLKYIKLPENITLLPENTFTKCESLTEVTIPAKVSNIGETVFYYCDNLKKIIFTGDAPVFSQYALLTVNAAVFYPEGNRTWTEDVFQNYGGKVTWVAGDGSNLPPASNLFWNFDEATGTLTISGDGPMGDYNMSTVPWRAHSAEVISVVVQEGITSVGNFAFCNFPKLSRVSLPSTVTSIGENAFYYCSKLTSIAIPGSVTEIGDKAFYDCWQLADLSLSQGLEEIGDEAFQRCKALTSLALPEGLLVIGTNGFAECGGLKTVSIPTSMTHIQSGAFGNCVNLESFSMSGVGEGYSVVDGILYDAKQSTLIQAPTAISGSCVVPKSVRHIQDKAFWRCSNLKELVFSDHITTIGPYAFYESTLIVCYPRGYTSWDDMKADYGGTITWAQIGLVEVGGETGYISSGNNRRSTLDFEYTDEWFYEDCTDWQPELARMSMKLSLTASQTKTDDIKALYEKLELDNITVWYPQPSLNTEGYIIGSRMIRPSADGETSMLVAVTFRGGGCNEETAQNFQLGNSSEHSGYRQTADKLVSAVRKHIEATGVTENIKIWVTGFGRGGSVANIAAHRLNTYADEGKIPGLSRDNIYAYCFANSNVVKTTSAEYKTRDNNIFNLTNPNDYTAYLPFTNWKYARYGTDYYLPTSMHMFTEYGEAYAKMQGNFVAMLVKAGNIFIGFDEEEDRLKFDFGIVLPEIPLQSEAIKMIAGDLSWILMDEYIYTQDYQADIMAAIEHMTWEVNYALPGLILEVIVALLPGRQIAKLVSCISETQESFSQAHWPEVWVAWLDAIEDDRLLQMSMNTRYFSTNCPVDLSVYDSSGNLVAQFVDDVPQRISGSTIRAYLDSDGQKIVVLPTDEVFQIETTATGNGNVSYQVQEYDIEKGTATRVIDYMDIPIQTGDKLTCSAGAGTDAEYTVRDQQGTVRKPDSERTGSEIVTHRLIVSADGDGTVSGSCSVLTNEFVRVQAEAGEGTLFLGWYQADQLISENNVYRFRLESDMELTAKFVRPEDCSITMQEYIALGKGQDAQLVVEVTPSFLVDKIVWNVDGNGIHVSETGKITAQEEGTYYIHAAIERGNLKRTAQCRVDVVEPETGEQEKPAIRLNGVQLGTTKLTTELYRTDYAEFDILLELPQNVNLMSIDRKNVPEDRGVAIDEIFFKDENPDDDFDLNDLFELIPLDDRRIAVVPKQPALDNPKNVAKSYKSAVTVWVDGEDYTTNEILTLTVKQSKPKLKAKIDTFNSFYTGQTQEITITGGTAEKITVKSYPDWLEPNEDGTLSLNKNAGKKNSGKVVLQVYTKEWNIPAEVTLTVKNTYKALGLKLNTSSVKIAESAAKADINLQLLPKSKNDTLVSLNVADISAPDGYEVQNFKPETGTFTLKANNGFKSDKITLQVKINGTEETVPLTLKVEIVKKNVSVSFKASGNLDLSLPNQTVTVKPTFKNYSGSFTFTETETEQFKLKQDGNVISVQCKEGTKPDTYVVPMKLIRDDGQAMDGSVKLTVKKTAIKLKLSSSKLSLNSTISDQASITVTCTTKGYDLKDPIVNVMDKSGQNSSNGLYAAYSNGKLTVSVNDNTKPDTAYKVLVKAYEGAPAATLTVSTLKANKSTITASLKLSGSLDVIRDGSAVTVTPSYKNCSNTAERTEILQVLDKDNKVIADSSWEENTILNIQKDTQGRYILTRVSGAKLDHTQKYTVKLISDFGGDAPATAEKAMKLKMGSAKLTLKSGSNILFSRDSRSRVNFSLTAKDVQLNDIKEVTSKDDRFKVYSYGNGEFALGFANNTVDKSLQGKTVTVTLNIFLDGNETQKANTTAKLKVTILK